MKETLPTLLLTLTLAFLAFPAFASDRNSFPGNRCSQCSYQGGQCCTSSTADWRGSGRLGGETNPPKAQ